jgi:threonine/homoserine/homoserine lactone efflux protein
MGAAMGIGRSAALAMSAGIASGTLTWSTLSVIGLSVVIAGMPSAMVVIKIIGGAYLLWLSYKSIKSALSKMDVEARPEIGNDQRLWRYFFRGYLINMTNPKAAIGWIAIVALGLDANAPDWMGLAIIAGTTLISSLVHMTYSALFSTQRIMNFYSLARRPIQACLGLFFAFASYTLVMTSV